MNRTEKIIRLTQPPFNFSQAAIARLYQISQARVSQLIQEWEGSHGL